MCAVPPAVPQEMCHTSCSASRDVPYLLQCLKSCAVPPAVPQEMCRTSCSASRDVPYILQYLKRCVVPPAVPQEMCRTSLVPQEMCRTSCSASIDVPYLLQCLKNCAMPPAVPQEMCRTSCSAPHFVTFCTHVIDSRCPQSVLLLFHSLLTVHSRKPTSAAAVSCCVASVCILMNLH